MKPDNLYPSHYSFLGRHSVYCLVDELLQGSFGPRRKKKNEISYRACIGAKNKKGALKLVYYHENRRIPYDLST